tara:strand:- start:682 stop:969 length:288 start_codon:yes stop_codon:yes gene_type:complete
MANTYHCIACHATRPSKGWKQLGWEIHHEVDEILSETIGKTERYRFDSCPDCKADGGFDVACGIEETMQFERSQIMHNLYVNPDDCDCLICHPNQ